MNRDWNDFKCLHSNISGAREAFENACGTLFRKMNTDQHVSGVKVKVGDGGIDIFVGELGVSPITVIQCKFFLESFGESQKQQIRESFGTAINSSTYELKEWILCIPRQFDIDDSLWWCKWKDKQIKEYSKPTGFIQLFDGDTLIDLLKQNNLYKQIFEIEDSEKIAAIYDTVVPKKVEIPQNLNPKIILFNNYSVQSEPYYHERSADREFVNSLKINNIWVFGNSGVGKTALVNRNLIKNNIDYCFCDLSPISIVNSYQVMEEILCKIEEKFNLERSASNNNMIKQLTQLMCQAGKQEMTIVIDELAVKENRVLKDIAADLIRLVVHYCNTSNEQSLKFIISTISNPIDIVENISKGSEHFQYISCDDWTCEMDYLFDKLSASLNIDIESYKLTILKSSENSPRILKSIFRKIIVLDNLNNDSINKAITTTTNELIR